MRERDNQPLSTPGASEWLLFAPGDAAYAPTVELLRRQAGQAGDDWTRLQALNALLALGRGTPAHCRERRALVEKAHAQPDKFTFPAALAPATGTPEFRAQLPELIQLIFLYSPENEAGEDWVNPADFDPAQPAVRFFTSEPREFFILAADTLDPKGETELGKWRRQAESGSADVPSAG
jgi:hypothetical protein